MMSKDTISYFGELIGTFLLVFIGLGCNHVANLTDCGAGLLHVAAVWGMGVCVAIMVTGSISGAHLNPAITLAFFKNGDMPGRRVLPYILAQFIGAFLAAAAVYAIFSGMLAGFESAHGIVRGLAGSRATASLYGEFFPNPGLAKEGMTMAIWQAMLAEGIGTFMLAVAVLAIVRANKKGEVSSTAVPVLIGLALATIIFIIAPATQAGLNPARDFGPRVFAVIAGWGKQAFAGSIAASILVYIIAPCIGSLAGQTVFRAVANATDPEASVQEQAQTIAHM